jgi:F-type H+-transporting ATPase subunit b
MVFLMPAIFKRCGCLLLLLGFLAGPLGALPARAQEPAKTTPAAVEQSKSERGVVDYEWRESLWILLIFIILLVVLSKTAWKNVVDGLHKREERIRGDLAQAEQARLKAEAALQEYAAQLASAEGRVREMLSNAAGEGERIAMQIRTHAQQEGEEIKERALREIDAARKQAVRDVYEQGANLATSVAEKILRRQINADDARELVNLSLSQLQEV